MNMETVTIPKKVAKKIPSILTEEDKQSPLYKLMGSAKLKKFTKKEQEHWFDNYENVDTSQIFREHGLD